MNYPIRTFFKDTVVFKEGAVGDTAYILMRGRVELSRMIRGEKRHITTIKPTSIFGEMALILEDHRRLGTITAIEDIQVVEVGRGAMEDMLEDTPPILKVVLSTLVRRLRVSTCKLSYVPKLVHGAALLLDMAAKNDQVRVDLDSVLTTLNGLYGNSSEEGLHALDQLSECGLVSMAKSPDGGVAVHIEAPVFFLKKALECLGHPDGSVLAELPSVDEEYVNRGAPASGAGEGSFNVLDDDDLPDMEVLLGKKSASSQ